ncbi:MULTISPECIES: hypothetical protein [Lactobacillus]|uniref:Uncharacterized protein n=1 Tax=Lactobacillus xujianguonis TaxID=2495899 RepID=A0A437SW46_9LACO|nr:MULTISPECIES: hypothetical protein [Lactobacillus]RVU71133.1 hypothetical protein EJK17_03780 [Lactobacillus xujianguonis]RVU77480.1 hypothetical protein EJK20_01605 [Lactobacillus xujianguonis]
MKKWMFGLGAVTAAVAAGVATKVFLDKNSTEETEEAEKDRGVSPVYEEKNVESTENTEDEKDDDVTDLKADAINHGYVPEEY